ncbi:unnamed protein product [Rodentolepis nana]|uniref:BRCT domain-containing protein n=1 Tax=Rodentolepis nana TaxID=102285 RepID=A0A0R3T3F4_RODNA|nr:unnamed protein product [Rodentolepis nana]
MHEDGFDEDPIEEVLIQQAQSNVESYSRASLSVQTSCSSAMTSMVIAPSVDHPNVIVKSAVETTDVEIQAIPTTSHIESQTSVMNSSSLIEFGLQIPEDAIESTEAMEVYSVPLSTGENRLDSSQCMASTSVMSTLQIQQRLLDEELSTRSENSQQKSTSQDGCLLAISQQEFLLSSNVLTDHATEMQDFINEASYPDEDIRFSTGTQLNVVMSDSQEYSNLSNLPARSSPSTSQSDSDDSNFESKKKSGTTTTKCVEHSTTPMSPQILKLAKAQIAFKHVDGNSQTDTAEFLSLKEEENSIRVTKSEPTSSSPLRPSKLISTASMSPLTICNYHEKIISHQKHNSCTGVQTMDEKVYSKSLNVQDESVKTVLPLIEMVAQESVQKSSFATLDRREEVKTKEVQVSARTVCTESQTAVEVKDERSEVSSSDELGHVYADFGPTDFVSDQSSKSPTRQIDSATQCSDSPSQSSYRMLSVETQKQDQFEAKDSIEQVVSEKLHAPVTPTPRISTASTMSGYQVARPSSPVEKTQIRRLVDSATLCAIASQMSKQGISASTMTEDQISDTPMSTVTISVVAANTSSLSETEAPIEQSRTQLAESELRGESPKDKHDIGMLCQLSALESASSGDQDSIVHLEESENPLIRLRSTGLQAVAPEDQYKDREFGYVPVKFLSQDYRALLRSQKVRTAIVKLEDEQLGHASVEFVPEAKVLVCGACQTVQTPSVVTAVCTSNSTQTQPDESQLNDAISESDSPLSQESMHEDGFDEDPIEEVLIQQAQSNVESYSRASLSVQTSCSSAMTSMVIAPSVDHPNVIVKSAVETTDVEIQAIPTTSHIESQTSVMNSSSLIEFGLQIPEDEQLGHASVEFVPEAKVLVCGACQTVQTPSVVTAVCTSNSTQTQPDESQLNDAISESDSPLSQESMHEDGFDEDPIEEVLIQQAQSNVESYSRASLSVQTSCSSAMTSMVIAPSVDHPNVIVKSAVETTDVEIQAIPTTSHIESQTSVMNSSSLIEFGLQVPEDAVEPTEKSISTAVMPSFSISQVSSAMQSTKSKVVIKGVSVDAYLKDIDSKSIIKSNISTGVLTHESQMKSTKNYSEVAGEVIPPSPPSSPPPPQNSPGVDFQDLSDSELVFVIEAEPDMQNYVTESTPPLKPDFYDGQCQTVPVKILPFAKDLLFVEKSSNTEFENSTLIATHSILTHDIEIQTTGVLESATECASIETQTKRLSMNAACQTYDFVVSKTESSIRSVEVSGNTLAPLMSTTVQSIPEETVFEKPVKLSTVSVSTQIEEECISNYTTIGVSTFKEVQTIDYPTDDSFKPDDSKTATSSMSSLLQSFTKKISKPKLIKAETQDSFSNIKLNENLFKGVQVSPVMVTSITQTFVHQYLSVETETAVEGTSEPISTADDDLLYGFVNVGTGDSESTFSYQLVDEGTQSAYLASNAFTQTSFSPSPNFISSSNEPEAKDAIEAVVSENVHAAPVKVVNNLVSSSTMSSHEILRIQEWNTAARRETVTSNANNLSFHSRESLSDTINELTTLVNSVSTPSLDSLSRNLVEKDGLKSTGTMTQDLIYGLQTLHDSSKADKFRKLSEDIQESDHLKQDIGVMCILFAENSQLRQDTGSKSGIMKDTGILAGEIAMHHKDHYFADVPSKIESQDEDQNSERFLDESVSDKDNTHDDMELIQIEARQAYTSIPPDQAFAQIDDPQHRCTSVTTGKDIANAPDSETAEQVCKKCQMTFVEQVPCSTQTRISVKVLLREFESRIKDAAPSPSQFQANANRGVSSTLKVKESVGTEIKSASSVALVNAEMQCSPMAISTDCQTSITENAVSLEKPIEYAQTTSVQAVSDDIAIEEMQESYLETTPVPDVSTSGHELITTAVMSTRSISFKNDYVLRNLPVVTSQTATQTANSIIALKSESVLPKEVHTFPKLVSSGNQTPLPPIVSTSSDWTKIEPNSPTCTSSDHVYVDIESSYSVKAIDKEMQSELTSSSLPPEPARIYISTSTMSDKAVIVLPTDPVLAPVLDRRVDSTDSLLSLVNRYGDLSAGSLDSLLPPKSISTGTMTVDAFKVNHETGTPDNITETQDDCPVSQENLSMITPNESSYIQMHLRTEESENIKASTETKLDIGVSCLLLTSDSLSVKHQVKHRDSIETKDTGVMSKVSGELKDPSAEVPAESTAHAPMVSVEIQSSPGTFNTECQTELEKNEPRMKENLVDSASSTIASVVSAKSDEQQSRSKLETYPDSVGQAQPEKVEEEKNDLIEPVFTEKENTSPVPVTNLMASATMPIYKVHRTKENDYSTIEDCTALIIYDSREQREVEENSSCLLNSPQDGKNTSTGTMVTKPIKDTSTVEVIGKWISDSESDDSGKSQPKFKKVATMTSIEISDLMSMVEVSRAVVSISTQTLDFSQSVVISFDDGESLCNSIVEANDAESITQMGDQVTADELSPNLTASISNQNTPSDLGMKHQLHTAVMTKASIESISNFELVEKDIPVNSLCSRCQKEVSEDMKTNSASTSTQTQISIDFEQSPIQKIYPSILKDEKNDELRNSISEQNQKFITTGTITTEDSHRIESSSSVVRRMLKSSSIQTSTQQPFNTQQPDTRTIDEYHFPSSNSLHDVFAEFDNERDASKNSLEMTNKEIQSVCQISNASSQTSYALLPAVTLLSEESKRKDVIEPVESKEVNATPLPFANLIATSTMPISQVSVPLIQEQPTESLISLLNQMSISSSLDALSARQVTTGTLTIDPIAELTVLTISGKPSENSVPQDQHEDNCSELKRSAIQTVFKLGRGDSVKTFSEIGKEPEVSKNDIGVSCSILNTLSTHSNADYVKSSRINSTGSMTIISDKYHKDQSTSSPPGGFESVDYLAILRPTKSSPTEEQENVVSKIVQQGNDLADLSDGVSLHSEGLARAQSSESLGGYPPIEEAQIDTVHSSRPSRTQMRDIATITIIEVSSQRTTREHEGEFKQEDVPSLLMLDVTRNCVTISTQTYDNFRAAGKLSDDDSLTADSVSDAEKSDVLHVEEATTIVKDSSQCLASTMRDQCSFSQTDVPILRCMSTMTDISNPQSNSKSSGCITQKDIDQDIPSVYLCLNCRKAKLSSSAQTRLSVEDRIRENGNYIPLRPRDCSMSERLRSASISDPDTSFSKPTPSNMKSVSVITTKVIRSSMTSKQESEITSSYEPRLMSRTIILARVSKCSTSIATQAFETARSPVASLNNNDFSGASSEISSRESLLMQMEQPKITLRDSAVSTTKSILKRTPSGTWDRQTDQRKSLVEYTSTSTQTQIYIHGAGIIDSEPSGNLTLEESAPDTIENLTSDEKSEYLVLPGGRVDTDESPISSASDSYLHFVLPPTHKSSPNLLEMDRATPSLTREPQADDDLDEDSFGSNETHSISNQSVSGISDGALSQLDENRSLHRWSLLPLNVSGETLVTEGKSDCLLLGNKSPNIDNQAKEVDLSEYEEEELQTHILPKDQEQVKSIIRDISAQTAADIIPEIETFLKPFHDEDYAALLRNKREPKSSGPRDDQAVDKVSQIPEMPELPCDLEYRETKRDQGIQRSISASDMFDGYISRCSDEELNQCTYGLLKEIKRRPNYQGDYDIIPHKSISNQFTQTVSNSPPLYQSRKEQVEKKNRFSQTEDLNTKYSKEEREIWCQEFLEIEKEIYQIDDEVHETTEMEIQYLLEKTLGISEILEVFRLRVRLLEYELCDDFNRLLTPAWQNKIEVASQETGVFLPLSLALRRNLIHLADRQPHYIDSIRDKILPMDEAFSLGYIRLATTPYLLDNAGPLVFIERESFGWSNARGLGYLSAVDGTKMTFSEAWNAGYIRRAPNRNFVVVWDDMLSLWISAEEAIAKNILLISCKKDFTLCKVRRKLYRVSSVKPGGSKGQWLNPLEALTYGLFEWKTGDLADSWLIRPKVTKQTLSEAIFVPPSQELVPLSWKEFYDSWQEGLVQLSAESNSDLISLTDFDNRRLVKAFLNLVVNPFEASHKQLTDGQNFAKPRSYFEFPTPEDDNEEMHEPVNAPCTTTKVIKTTRRVKTTSKKAKIRSQQN